MTAQRKAVFVDGVVVTYEDESVGVPGGLASLDGSGKVPSWQLPAYVDDVVEYPDVASFPPVGVSGIIYIAISPAPSQGYRWSGSTYSQIGSSLALGETSSTAYRGDRGKAAYDHSQITGANPHGTTAAQVGALPASGGTTGDFLIWTSPTSVGSGPLTWDGGPLITTPKGIRSSSSIEGLSLRVSGNPVVDPTRNAHFASVTSDDLAGTGTRAAAVDSTGKLVEMPLGWNSYDIQTVTGTTAATEAFSSGSGVGSATLAGGSLSVGDRIRLHFAVRSSVADSATLTAKIGSSTICTFTLYVGSDDTLDIDMTVTNTGIIASSRRSQGINGTVWVGLSNIGISLATDQAISVTIQPATTSYQFSRYIARLDIN